MTQALGIDDKVQLTPQQIWSGAWPASLNYRFSPLLGLEQELNMLVFVLDQGQRQRGKDASRNDSHHYDLFDHCWGYSSHLWRDPAASKRLLVSQQCRSRPEHALNLDLT